MITQKGAQGKEGRKEREGSIGSPGYMKGIKET